MAISTDSAPGSATEAPDAERSLASADASRSPPDGQPTGNPMPQQGADGPVPDAAARGVQELSSLLLQGWTMSASSNPRSPSAAFSRTDCDEQLI